MSPHVVFCPYGRSVVVVHNVEVLVAFALLAVLVPVAAEFLTSMSVLAVHRRRSENHSRRSCVQLVQLQAELCLQAPMGQQQAIRRLSVT